MSSPEKDAGSTTIRYFGDYLLLGEIASGGMGVVYSAQQVSLNRAVAVKLIRAGQMATEAELRRFHTEAEAAAKLDHPNIVPIYEIGTHEGQPFVSMKLIDGDSLADRMANGEFRMTNGGATGMEDGTPAAPAPVPLAHRMGERSEVRAKGEGRGEGERSSISKSENRPLQTRIATLLAKVARAVHHAHQRGVLHRDIKPGNILLDENGEPHLTDFGLAKLLERDSSQSLSGTVLGTPGYMAPEQAAGQTRRITAASDIYSLGAVLYALLTGRPPFHGESPAETLDWVRTREPQRPRSLNPLADSDLETICLKCLEKDPSRRYPTAQALAEDLERWLRGEPILARPVRPWERFGKWVRRNPVIAGLGTTIIGLLALNGGTWLWQRVETGTVKWKSVKTHTVQAMPNFGYRIKSTAQVAVTLPAAPATGNVVRLSGVGPGGWRLVQNSNQVIFTENIGAGAAGWVWTPRDSGDRQWYDVASSADGMKLAAVEFGYANGGGWIYTSTNGGINWTQCGSKRPWTCVGSSADGTKLVAAGGWNTKIYTSTNSGATWTSHEPRGSWTHVASSADGNKLVAVDNGTNTAGGYIYTSTDGGMTWTPRESKRNWECVASSADGTKLVAAVGLIDIKGRSVFGQVYTSTDSGVSWTARMTDRDRQWTSVASSADGRKLVAVEKFGSEHTDVAKSLDAQAGELLDQGKLAEAERLAREALALRRKLLGTKHPDVAISLSNLRLVLAMQGRRAGGEGARAEAAALGLEEQATYRNLDPAIWPGGRIYISADSGVTWTPHGPSALWQSVASSVDGNKLVALNSPPDDREARTDWVYTSTDAGLTWTSHKPVKGWKTAASSADGSKLVAVVAHYETGHNSFIYTSGLTTVPGPAGSFSAAQGSELELQYLGDHQFRILSASGTLTVEGTTVKRQANPKAKARR